MPDRRGDGVAAARNQLIRQAHERARRGGGTCYHPGQTWTGADGATWSGCMARHPSCWHVHAECSADCAKRCPHHSPGGRP